MAGPQHAFYWLKIQRYILQIFAALTDMCEYMAIFGALSVASLWLVSTGTQMRATSVLKSLTLVNWHQLVVGGTGNLTAPRQELPAVLGRKRARALIYQK